MNITESVSLMNERNKLYRSTCLHVQYPSNKTLRLV